MPAITVIEQNLFNVDAAPLRNFCVDLRHLDGQYAVLKCRVDVAFPDAGANAEAAGIFAVTSFLADDFSCFFFFVFLAGFGFDGQYAILQTQIFFNDAGSSAVI